MKLDIKTTTNSSAGKKDLPSQFAEPVRKDLIKKAVEVIQGNKRQPYGSKPEAGMRHSAELSRRRRKYRGSYGHGISRVPRKILSRRGTQFHWAGAVAPGTKGGRRAHPPKVYKIWAKKMNVKERRKAIRSALAATMNKEQVATRGHAVPEQYPFLIETKFEGLQKTKDVQAALTKLGLADELSRASVKKVRAGKGKMRGRKYQKRKGPLLVVSKACDLFKAAQNIPGVDVTLVEHLNAEVLAPGADIGRLTLFTEAAVERLAKEQLFTNGYVNKAAQEARQQNKDKKVAKTKAKKEKRTVAKAKKASKPKKAKKFAKAPAKEAKKETPKAEAKETKQTTLAKK